MESMSVKGKRVDSSCEQWEPVKRGIDVTGSVLQGQGLLRLKGRQTEGCKVSHRAWREEGEEKMGGETFQKKRNLTTGTKMLNVHDI